MRHKHARTYHLPWSPGSTSDDKRHAEVESLFGGEEVVVLEKMDGENTTIYADGFTHARSIDSGPHPSREKLRALAAWVGVVGVPETLRICGENLHARHSISYDALSAHFLAFSVYDGDQCLPWDEVVFWCDLLEVQHVPVLWRGTWDEAAVRACWTGRSVASPGDEQEGYVVRLASGFRAADWPTSSAKFVRAGHVQTGSHWMHESMVPNGLRRTRSG